MRSMILLLMLLPFYFNAQYINVGSTKKEVKAVLGEPKSIANYEALGKEVWGYGDSGIATLTFKNGKVKEYYNYKNILPIGENSNKKGANPPNKRSYDKAYAASKRQYLQDQANGPKSMFGTTSSGWGGANMSSKVNEPKEEEFSIDDNMWLIIGLVLGGLSILLIIRNLVLNNRTDTVENGNSKIPNEINNLKDAVGIVESEKLFNKATQFFKNGDYVSAVGCFEKAAKLGDKDALYQLGNMYLQGNGVKQDFDKAYDYYLESAELNHEKAQYNLALFYLQGDTKEKNIDLAKNWLTKSSNNGYSEADKVLNHLNELG